MTTRQQPGQRPRGAQPGNQNARRHGWYSQHDPAALDAIGRAVKEAITAGDVATLRTTAAAYRYHGSHSAALAVRRLANHLARRTLTAAAARAGDEPEAPDDG